MAVGNIEAIRDWMYKDWYNKEEIHKIFISSSTEDIYPDPGRDPSIPNRYLITGLDQDRATIKRYHDDILLGVDTISSMTTYPNAFRLSRPGAYIPGDLRWNMTALGRIKCNNVIYNNGSSVSNLNDNENIVRTYF